jgi:signal transduction histidine kinase
VLVRRGDRLAPLAATGLDGAPPGADGVVGEALRTRRLAATPPAALAGAPFPAGTRAAAAAPILSRGEIAGVAVAGSRSAAELPEAELLLLRLLAERSGRAIERLALVDSLADAEAAARRASGFRDQILGIVGHDLRNPLGAIAMSAALLGKRGGLGGWQAKTVARVRSSAGRMGRIIDDLLSYTRTRLGAGIPIEPRRADLRELAGRVVDELVANHPDTAIHLVAEGDLVGEWDPSRLEQVLSNLVSNAVDHGEPDHRVEVRLRGDGDLVELEVLNRGEIPPVVLEHAFEPFRRPPDHEARRASGLGLGLFIAREIVRGHGGDIAVRSAAGETRLAVRLPRRTDAAAARPGG